MKKKLIYYYLLLSHHFKMIRNFIYKYINYPLIIEKRNNLHYYNLNILFNYKFKYIEILLIFHNNQ